MSVIKVVLIDDHQIVRDGIKALLQDEQDIKIVAEAQCGEDLQNIISTNDTDIILMDISLPGKSGIELCKDLMQSNPQVKVLVLSMYLNEDFIMNAIKAGAKGYLPKNTSKSELITAIQTINGGDEFFGERVSEIILQSYMKNLKQKKEKTIMLETLSKREIEILKLFAEGHTNKEIADQLSISIRTVESHKTHIMQKLNTKSTVDLIKYAIKNKIVDL
jgi:DNA-binding NarL/FixJ family response regulator